MLTFRKTADHSVEVFRNGQHIANQFWVDREHPEKGGRVQFMFSVTYPYFTFAELNQLLEVAENPKSVP